VKKLLTLTLIVVMALGLAAPALAYTTNTAPEGGASPFTVDIYLVDNAGADPLANLLSLPNSDRGYAKNEIIAAIGALTVPKGEYVYGAGYTQLRFKPKNVSLNVTENVLNAVPATTVTLTNNSATALGTTALMVSSWATWGYASATTGLVTHTIANTSTPGANVLPINANADYTFRTLLYGKVLADEASLTFELCRGNTWGAATGYTGGTHHATTAVAGLAAPLTTSMGLVLNDDFLVYSNAITNPPLGPVGYFIHENAAASVSTTMAANPGALRFVIEVTNAKGKTARLFMFPGGFSTTAEYYRVLVEPSGVNLVFEVAANAASPHIVGDQIKYGTSGYDSLLAFYKEWFEEKLGFSAYNEGNLLTESDWTDIAAAAIDISDTVDIEPWTAYVHVPENIVVDPPKTGEAASAAGFITLLLAAAAMVVVKKVRA
jgi:hypothetical protein